MKRIYIDTETLREQEALASAGLPAQKPVGYCYDAHDHSYSLFVATDLESGELRRDVNGKLALNLRAQKRQA